MKNLILLFLLSFSVSIKAQTFIGKTKEEIMKLNINNKLSGTEKADNIIEDITFEDNKLPIDHRYSFDKKDLCVAYTIITSDKPTKEIIQKDIEKKSFEKISDKSWVQKVDGNIYGWHLQSGENFYAFSTTQIYQ